jgi:ornithine carbamoyltransferase
MKIAIAPAELQPPEDVQKVANELAERSGARLLLSDDPAEALPGAQFVHTDVWVSMGEAEEVWDQRIELLRPFQVNSRALALTENPDVRFMHCLPAFHDANTEVGRKVIERTGMSEGIEVTDEVFESPASIVFDQAENRLHTIKAVLVATLGA